MQNYLIIDKQTLIYYDNQGIFSPSYKNQNGYRYYSTDQILFFSVLLSLRNLNIHGELLAEYNQDRSIEKLTELLDNKIQEYTEIVELLSNKTTNLKKMISLIKEANHLPIKKFMLVPSGQIYCQHGSLIAKNTPMKKALLQSSPLISEYAKHLLTKRLQLSFMPIFNELDDLVSSYEYRVVLTTRETNVLSNPIVYKPGLYLTLLLNSNFHILTEESVVCLKSFIKKIKLHHKGSAFITPSNNLNFCKDSGQQYTKVEILVDYNA